VRVPRKQLSELITTLKDVISITDDVAITAPVVESDADVQPGGVYVARPGLSVDGHDFIAKAIERGAAAVVGQRDLTELPVPYVRVADAQQAVGYLAAAYHDFPSRHLTLIGVTGTDGKTTTSHILHHIMQGATDNRTGLISTIAAELGDEILSTGLHVTSPSAPMVQALLARLVAQGMTHCILEMTSHGLAQGRLNGVDIDVAVLTNVTHEHLDYHGTWEAYRDAKARMFRMLSASRRKGDQAKIAIINADDPSADYFAAITADVVVRYGIDNPADYRATNRQHLPSRTYFEIDEQGTFEMQLPGKFNILNALAAIATAHRLNVPMDTIRRGLAQVETISGRMQRIDEGQDFTAIVDFAHTPNALKRALETGREMLPEGKRLIAVFGSAGLRDREKRRLMAEVSAQLADFTILTAEDPRTESLGNILREMAAGCIAKGGVEGETFLCVPDRGAAIYTACQMAQAGDIVMACGKGHEQSMCFGTTEYPWDDRDAMRAALRGEPLRTLPTADEKYNA